MRAWFSNVLGRAGFVLSVEVIYLLVLFGVGYVYLVNSGQVGPWTVPSSLGSVPIGVVWFGVLGAVMISMSGIVAHIKDWDASLRYWHFSRPLVGAALAIVSVLIFQAGILAVGSNPTPNGVTTSTTNLLYYLIAFVVGYREEVFRGLIKRVADVILTPGGGAPAPTITGVNPDNGPAGGGQQIAIMGSGFTSVTAVLLGPTPAANFRVDSASQITATTPARPAGGAGTVSITVTTQTDSVTGGQYTYN